MTYNRQQCEEKEVEAVSNIRLILTKKLKDKLDYLSTKYTKSEISGFITYKEISKDENGVKIILDDLLIPPQKAHTSEVDVDGVGQIELRKEYGDKFLNIIGHWHSHHTMGAFFSSTDETMMNSYSENKNFRLFIVSSLGKHLIRFVLKNTINEKTNEMVEIKIENIEYEVEADESIQLEMEEEIKKKVKETEIKTQVYKSSAYDLKKMRKEIAVRIKYYQHQNHKVRVTDIFKEYANLISEEFKILNPIIEKGSLDNHYDVVVELGDRNKAKEFMCDVKEFLLQTTIKEMEEIKSLKEKAMADEEEEFDILKGDDLEAYLDEEEYMLHNDGEYTDRGQWTSYQQYKYNCGYFD